VNKNNLIKSPKPLIILVLILMCALFTGCYDNFDENEISPAEYPTTALETISSARMSVLTVDGSLSNSICEIIPAGNGEIYFICVPEDWNGELILYAHGYVSIYEPIQIPAEAEELAPLATSLDFAFATTSFSGNGLYVQQGISEMIQLKNF